MNEDYGLPLVQVTENVRYESDPVTGGFVVYCSFHGRIGNRETDGDAEALARKHASHKRETEAGQSIVELCLVSIILMFLLVGALDLGRLYYSQITITNAAREGALVASRGGKFVAGANCADNNTIMCATLAEAAGGMTRVTKTDVTATTCPAKPTAATPPISVRVEVNFQAITPFIAAVLGGGTVRLGATAASPCAYTPAVTLGAAPPPPCIVPTFIGMKSNDAKKAWADAKFAPVNLTVVAPSTGNPNIGSENPAASDGTSQTCATFVLTVTAP